MMSVLAKLLRILSSCPVSSANVRIQSLPLSLAGQMDRPVRVFRHASPPVSIISPVLLALVAQLGMTPEVTWALGQYLKLEASEAMMARNWE